MYWPLLCLLMILMLTQGAHLSCATCTWLFSETLAVVYMHTVCQYAHSMSAYVKVQMSAYVKVARGSQEVSAVSLQDD